MEVTRLFDIPLYQLKKYPNPTMLSTRQQGKWVSLSTEEFIRQGNQFSRGLLKMGVKPGDKMVLITHATRNEWAVADFGMSQIGVVSVPVYPTISAEDYAYIFNNAEVQYVIAADAELVEKVNSIKDQVGTLREVFSFDEVKDASPWTKILEAGSAEDNQAQVEELRGQVKEDDMATLIYTSGTTGKPKGVMLSHKNIVSNAMGSVPRIPKIKGKAPNEVRTLSFLPISHVFERMVFYLYQYCGFSVYFAESIEKMSDNLREVKPEIMTVVPRVLEKVYDKIYATGMAAGGLKSKIFQWALGVNKAKKTIGKPSGFKENLADKLVFSKWREALGGNIVTLVSGSAVLSPRLNKMFQNAGIPIMEGYGLTETSPVIAVTTLDEIRIGTVGRPLDNIEVKILEDGEIAVKGPSVFLGYYQNEEMTKENFTNDGYFRTGDIGNLDEEGVLTITDRKKEMFKTSGGKYVAPQVIENSAKASKFIEQIMVVGEGEKMPTALIQPDFEFVKKWAERKKINVGSSPAEIAANPEVKKRIEKEIDYLNTKLGDWEKVKKFELTPEVWTLEDGLLTPTLKLKRKVIKEKFMDLYNKMYGHDGDEK